MLWLAGFFFLVCRSIAQKLLKGSGGSGGGSGGGKSGAGGGSQKAKKATRLIPFGFLVLAVAALVYAPLPFGWGSIGSILAALAEWALGLPAALFSVPVATIAAVLLALVLVLGLIDLVNDLHPDAWAKWMVYTTPVLVLIAGGPLAPYVTGAIEFFGGVGPDAVAAIT